MYNKNVRYGLRIFKDKKIGRRTKYFISDKEINQLQIPDEIRKCVVFIYCSTQKGRKLIGTGFVVFEELKETDLGFTYLVTAKHIIEKAKPYSIDESIILRINTKDGSSTLISSKIGDWIFHPTNPQDDVAILPFQINKDLDLRTYPLKSFISKENIKKENIGLGDETFVAGLFVKHHGKIRNIPIIRVGNIIAMMEEEIVVKGGLIDGYLVEMRSFGGLSGSPVFVNLGTNRIVNGTQILRGGYKFYLLGLIRGHWDWEENNEDNLMLNKTESEDINTEAINMGIAIVTPASKILETINHPDLEKAKKEEIERINRGNLPTKDIKK